MAMEQRCKERVALEQKIVDAVQRHYSTTGTERDRARGDEKDSVKALNEHVRTHHCK
jgi:hypothetical protein